MPTNSGLLLVLQFAQALQRDVLGITSQRVVHEVVQKNYQVIRRKLRGNISLPPRVGLVVELAL